MMGREEPARKTTLRRTAAKERPHGRPAGPTQRRTRRPTGPAGEETSPRRSPKRPLRKSARQKGPCEKAPAKKAPAKKAPAKKAPAKKAPAKAPEPAPPPPAEVAIQQRIETNGDLAAAAKDAAAQAKSTVEAAPNPVSPEGAPARSGQSPVPLIVAVALSLLAILLIRQLRRR
ncbi:Rv3852 family protein [Mycobacterium interjectum]|uniref:Rv3852 family protein n=1 Tax=Mycobacterium interjectum TaxID=33895 RepID=UPI003FD7AAA5